MVTEKKSSNVGISIASVIMLIIALSVGSAIGKAVFRTNSSPDNWERHTVGKDATKLSLISPGELKQTDMDLPANLKSMVKSLENYDSKSSSNGISINVISASYNNNIVPNLQGAMDGSLNSVAAVEGVKIIEHTSRRFSVTGRDGGLLTIKAEKNGVISEMMQLIAIDGLKLWQVNIIYGSNSKEAKEAAQKVIDSVRLE